jgi:hypothetical protein
MDEHPAFFTLAGDGLSLTPGVAAHSGWNPDHVRGPAVAGVLARAAEGLAAERPEVRPVRATFELFRPSKMRPSRTRATTVRSGRRLMLVDSFLEQDGEVVARASVLFLAAGIESASAPWQSPESFPPPPPGLPLDAEGRVYRSGDGPWTTQLQRLPQARRNQVWQTPVPVVRGEKPSPFQSVAVTSDLASLVVHLDPTGLGYINADVTLSLSRLPDDGDVGLAAAQQIAVSGISTGVAVLFDRRGTIGSATVSALASAEQAIAPRGTRLE